MATVMKKELIERLVEKMKNDPRIESRDWKWNETKIMAKAHIDSISDLIAEIISQGDDVVFDNIFEIRNLPKNAGEYKIPGHGTVVKEGGRKVRIIPYGRLKEAADASEPIVKKRGETVKPKKGNMNIGKYSK